MAEEIKTPMSEFDKVEQVKDTAEIILLQDGVNARVEAPIFEQKILDKTNDRYLGKAEKGAPNGIASLDENKKVPNENLTFGEIKEGDKNVVSGDEVFDSLTYTSNIFDFNFDEKSHISKAIKYIIVTENRNYNFQLLTLVRDENGSYEIKFGVIDKVSGVNVINIQWKSSEYEKGCFEKIVINHAFANFEILINWAMLPEKFVFRKVPNKIYELNDKCYDVGKNYNARLNIKSVFPFQKYTVRFQALTMAVREMWIENYNENNTYHVSILRKNFNGKTFIRIIEANGLNEVKRFNFEYGLVSGVELLNVDNVYILIDWDKIIDNIELQDALNGNYGIDNKVQYLELSPYINSFLNKADIDLSSYATKQYISDNSFSKQQSDSRFELKGNLSATSYKFQDARDFGLLPTNNATQNVNALQNALNGGNKTLTISTPGKYVLNNTIYIDSNTELVIGKGVYFVKESAYYYVFANRNIYNREVRDHDITIKGLDLDCNKMEVIKQNDYDSLTFGLRGNLSFWRVDNLHFEDLKCYNFHAWQWGLQVCNFNNFSINRFYISGHKDGIHLGGKSKLANISNGRFMCYDDSIALNCFDYPASNPEIGDIEDVCVTNVYDQYNKEWDYGSRFTLLLVGTPVRWRSGIKICNGDAVVYDGSTYMAITELFDGTEIVSTTPPSQADFGKSYLTAEKIRWVKKDNVEVRSAQISNVNYTNLTHDFPKQSVLISCFIDQTKEYSRTLHPEVPMDEYPDIKGVTLTNVSSNYGSVWLYNKVRVDLGISALKRENLTSTYLVRSFEVREGSVLSFDGCRFSTFDKIESVKNLKTVFKSNKNQKPIIIDNYKGRIVSDSSVIIKNINELTPVNGDYINDDGFLKIYKNKNWTTL